MSEYTRVGKRGTIVLPAKLRRRYGFEEGTMIVAEEAPYGVLLRPAPAQKATRLDQVYGCAGYTGAAKTLAQMDAAIVAEAKRRNVRG